MTIQTGTWAERHPFWMAFIASAIVSIYAIVYHALKIGNNQWPLVAMWIPTLWIIPYSVAFISWFSEKGK